MDKRMMILQILLQYSDCASNNKIQKILKVSRRTVINYIREINSEHGAIISSSNKGYWLNDKKAALRLLTNDALYTIPSDYESRKSYLLKNLLLAGRQPSVEDLADELCISPITFTNELTHLRNELKEHNLYIKQKKDKLYIIGDERDRRRYIHTILSQELEHSQFNMDAIQKYFRIVKISDIKEVVETIMQIHAFILDGFSLLNYVLHLAICIENSAISTSQVDGNQVNLEYPPHICIIIDEVYDRLKELYPNNFTAAQIYDASMLMATRMISQHLSKLAYQQIDDYVDPYTKELLMTVIDSVHEMYGIDLKTDSFMVRFALHLKNMIIRSDNNISLHQNNILTIKDEYPFLYVIATYIASIINKNIGHLLPESEITYIALHLGVLMEERKANQDKLTCAIVMYDYYNFGAALYQNLTTQFYNLLVLDIVQNYEQINQEDAIDLIITTLPVKPSLEIPQIKISMMLTPHDYKAIRSKTDELLETAVKTKTVRKVKHFFRSDLFFADTTFSHYQEVLDFMCNKMQELNYVDSTFKDAIYEHEKYVSSAYKNIAIPHPLGTSASQPLQSSIAVLINKQPIQWLDNKVDIVLMLSLKKEDNSLFRDIFGLITETISNKKLIQCKDYESFIRSFITAP